MKRAIGIFDSGVGGLTVFKSIREKLPAEHIIYFGDTARVPYGPKSKDTVIKYSIQNALFLMQYNIKCLVVACNTSSSVALPVLANRFDVPIIGVIRPGAEKAVSITKNKKIGIIGTERTIRSRAYAHEIKEIDANCQVFSKACPLFVPLVEESWANRPETKSIAKDYLQVLLKKDIDTLILGCTHYPILKPIIEDIVGKKVKIIDSAQAVADMITQEIAISKNGKLKGKNKFFVSDNIKKFVTIGRNIINCEIEDISLVSLVETWYPNR
ncbi:MAG: glutamate racemase [Candidatus Cloacimonadota bacterium]|nr:MAG: glutamate racemase [Candidatus Cloacimonadota bacterium]